MNKFKRMRYLFDEDKTEEELIILLSVFHGNADNQSTLEPLFKSKEILGYFVIEEGLIQRTLISTAMSLRMIDDRLRVNAKNVKIHYPNVGHLLTTTESKNTTLSLREACNKIIHANYFHLNTKPNKVNEAENLEGIITLEGSNRKGLWTANIDIEKYVVNGLCLTKFYGEDWESSAR